MAIMTEEQIREALSRTEPRIGRLEVEAKLCYANGYDEDAIQAVADGEYWTGYLNALQCVLRGSEGESPCPAP